jgi:hypothetical protein
MSIARADHAVSLASSFRRRLTLRLVLRCRPTRSQVLAVSRISVDLPRIRQWTSRPRTTTVSKSLDAASSALATVLDGRLSGT